MQVFCKGHSIIKEIKVVVAKADKDKTPVTDLFLTRQEYMCLCIEFGISHAPNVDKKFKEIFPEINLHVGV